MARLIVHLEHAILAISLAMGSLHGLLIRANHVGIAGIALELCGRIALTTVQTALAQIQARHLPRRAIRRNRSNQPLQIENAAST